MGLTWAETPAHSGVVNLCLWPQGGKRKEWEKVRWGVLTLLLRGSGHSACFSHSIRPLFPPLVSPHVQPRNPCQWIELESFSSHLADSREGGRPQGPALQCQGSSQQSNWKFTDHFLVYLKTNKQNIVINDSTFLP